MDLDPVLVIDDEEDIRELISISLDRLGLEAVQAESMAEARSAIDAGKSYSLCLTDVRLPDGSGIDLITPFRAKHPRAPVIVITAYGSADLAVEAMRAGAFDFIAKPIKADKLRQVIDHAVASQKSVEASAETLVGTSKVMRRLREQIAKVARSQAPVLIYGESGTGKELVARAIHSNSHLHDKPFVPVNCGAIPTELMESEFFGHVKGSFTGATSDKRGLFQAASGGTLFLDEIADLPLHMQVKLLRALQEKAIRPVGGDREITTDVRVLSATNKNLRDEVSAGRFRQDLYYRINVIEIDLPPLRDRIEDLPELCNKILGDQPLEENALGFHLTPAAFDQLRSYPYPGNVRELENILQRAAALCDDGLIQPKDLNLRVEAPLADQKVPNESTDAAQIESLDSHMESMEREILERVLNEERWNRTAAAKRLGLTLRQIRYKLSKYGMDS